MTREHHEGTDEEELTTTETIDSEETTARTNELVSFPRSEYACLDETYGKVAPTLQALRRRHENQFESNVETQKTRPTSR